MKIGVALPRSDWPDGRVWSFPEIVDYALRAEAAGYDSVWTNDHYFLEYAGPRRPGGPEPMVLLSYLAGKTSRVELGTMVLCALFRDPGQLAREARALAELSDGRLILGIGAGWHGAELEAFGLPTDYLFSRFEEYVEALLPLLAGERVDHDGRYQTLRGAEVFGSAAPPVWIGGSGPKMLQLTGRVADGWNGADAANLEAIRAAATAAGRSADSVVPSTAISVLLADPDEARRLLEEHPPRMGTVVVGIDELRDAVETRRAAGFEHLILHLSGAIWSSYGDGQPERAAEALSLGR